MTHISLLFSFFVILAITSHYRLGKLVMSRSTHNLPTAFALALPLPEGHKEHQNKGVETS